jgi:hypothetical protein
MHRLTARLLLVLMLVGTLAPPALAFSATPPHACCLRKLHQQGFDGPAFQAPTDADRSCCRTLASTQWAETGLSVKARVALACSALQGIFAPARPATEPGTSHSGRAPPQFSV